MKARGVFSVLALLACVLGTQAEAKVNQSEKLFEKMAQSTLQADAEAESLRNAVPALAYLPADIDAFIALSHIEEHVGRAMKDGFLLDQPVGAMPPELAAWESAAVSLGDGSANGLRLLLPLLVDSSSWLYSWMDEAKPEIAQRVYDLVQQLEEHAHAKASASFHRHWELKPMYAVLTFKEGHEQMVRQWGSMIVSMVLASHAESAELIKHGELQGVKISNMPVADGDARDVFLMIKPQGNALVVALCAKPEDLSFPAQMADSVLSRGYIKADVATLKDLLLVCYAGKDFVAAAQKYNRDSIAQSVGMARTVFELLAAVYPAQSAIYGKAVQGVETMLSQLLQGKADINKESVLLCSLNKEKLTLEYSGDAAGCSYAPGVLRYAAQADEKNNILYAESTPCTGAQSSMDFSAFSSAAMDVLRAYALTLPDDKQSQLSSALSMLDKLTPELRALGGAWGTVSSGLSRGGAVLIDAAGSLPALFGGTASNRVAIPRIAYCCGVENRAKLGDGWKQMLDAAGAIVGKMGGSPALVRAIPFVSKKTGNSISHCLYMPIFTEHMIPNVTVSDKCFVAGTSSAYNEKLSAAATGSLNFSGSVFALHFTPLAKMMRGIADAYRARIPAVEEAVPMSQFNHGGVVVGGASEAESATVSQLEEVAATLDEYAVAAELISSVAESCYTTVIVNDARLVLRTVVHLCR